MRKINNVFPRYRQSGGSSKTGEAFWASSIHSPVIVVLDGRRRHAPFAKNATMTRPHLLAELAAAPSPRKCETLSQNSLNSAKAFSRSRFIRAACSASSGGMGTGMFRNGAEIARSWACSWALASLALRW